MTALAKHDDGYFTREQIETLKSVICPGLTDAELNLVSEVCRQTRLSPFARQIHVTKRGKWDPDQQRSVPTLTIQTGIDGYRLVAERTAKYRGQLPFEWCGLDGAWRDVWLAEEPPAAARATVLKEGSEPSVAVARWKAYVQTKKDGKPNSMWAKMGAEQLAKCAEALALRKAFPQELSGIYTDVEMGQADNGKPELVDAAPPKAIEAQASRPLASARSAGRLSSTTENTEMGTGTATEDSPGQTNAGTSTTTETSSVPPPAEAGPVMFAAAYPEWGGKPITEAPAATVLAYIDTLEAILKDPKKQAKRAYTVTHLRKVETIYDAMVTAEIDAAKLKERQQVDIEGKLQAAIDAKDATGDEGPDNWQLRQEATP